MRENRLAKRVGRTRGRLAPELLLLSVAYGLGLTAGHFIGAGRRSRCGDPHLFSCICPGSRVRQHRDGGIPFGRGYGILSDAVRCFFLQLFTQCKLFLLRDIFTGGLSAVLRRRVLFRCAGAAGSFDFPVYAGDSGNVRPPGIAVFGFAQAKVCAGNCRTAGDQAAVSAAGSGRRFLFLIPALLALGGLCELTFVPKLTALALKFIV